MAGSKGFEHPPINSPIVGAPKTTCLCVCRVLYMRVTYFGTNKKTTLSQRDLPPNGESGSLATSHPLPQPPRSHRLGEGVVPKDTCAAGLNAGLHRTNSSESSRTYILQILEQPQERKTRGENREAPRPQERVTQHMRDNHKEQITQYRASKIQPNIVSVVPYCVGHGVYADNRFWHQNHFWGSV